MTAFLVLLAAAAAAAGVLVIEKRRRQGELTYPLWKVNVLIPWVILAVLFAALTASVNMPRYVTLLLRGAQGQAVVTEVNPQKHCEVKYRYTVEGRDFTGTESFCGAAAGSASAVYYDPQEPALSSLHMPQDALETELLAMLLVSLFLPTVIVLWLKVTQVIGKPKKP